MRLVAIAPAILVSGSGQQKKIYNPPAAGSMSNPHYSHLPQTDPESDWRYGNRYTPQDGFTPASVEEAEGQIKVVQSLSPWEKLKKWATSNSWFIEI